MATTLVILFMKLTMRPHQRTSYLYFEETESDIKRAKDILQKGYKRNIYFVDKECDIKVLLSVCLENNEIIIRDSKHKILCK